MIYDSYDIYTVYLFFSVMAFVGVLLNVFLIKLEKKITKKESYWVDNWGKRRLSLPPYLTSLLL